MYSSDFAEVVDHAIMAAETKTKTNPDEDDFHTFKRKQMRVEKAIKAEDKLLKHSAASAPAPQKAKAKAKVVAF